MSENAADELFLPSARDEELLDNLLCGEDVAGEAGFSLTSALLPLVAPPSPPPTPWVCSTRYKTELCTSYASTGSCKYAQCCQFAHGLQELHVPFRHPKYKTELCRNYHATGYCFYGERCLFVHEPAELRPLQHQRRNVPCRRFLANRVCPFGKRCHFLHVEDEAAAERPCQPAPPGLLPPEQKERRPRGAMCHTFSLFGFCLYGTSCRFQHGLPSRMKSCDLNPGGSPGLPSGCSSSSSSSGSPLPTPSPEPTPHNAFTFSSQHLSDLLLPLAVRLQQLEGNKSHQVWDGSRAL